MKESRLVARLRRETRKIQVRRACGPLLLAGVLALAAPPLGCGGRASAPAVAPPAYTAEEATLFNDLFRPELFGIESFGEPPEHDRLLSDRVARAEWVVAARVVTVTREAESAGAAYSVVLEPIAAPLVGPPSGGRLALTVRAGSPAHAWIDASRDACIGIRALVFVRTYADGSHFYATVDSPAVRDAVIRARIERSGRR